MCFSKLSISDIFWFCMYSCSFRASPTPSKRSLSCKSPVKTQKKLLSKTDSAVELVNNAQFYLLFCATYWDWVEYFYQPICQSNPGPRIPPGAASQFQVCLEPAKTRISQQVLNQLVWWLSLQNKYNLHVGWFSQYSISYLWERSSKGEKVTFRRTFFREFSNFSVSFQMFLWCMSQIPNPTSPQRDVCCRI